MAGSVLLCGGRRERERERGIAREERTTDQPAWQPGRQAARWPGRQLG